MIKKLLLLILLVASVNSFAYFDKTNLNGGVNFSTLSGDLDLNSKLGFDLGVSAVKTLSDDSNVSVGITYAFKNFADKKINGLDWGFSTQWIEIPVIYNHKIGKAWVYGGAYVSFKTNEDVELSDTLSVSSKTFESTDYGIKVGGSYQIIDSGSIYADYSFGLADVLKTDTDSKLSSLSVGYSHTF